MTTPSWRDLVHLQYRFHSNNSRQKVCESQRKFQEHIESEATRILDSTEPFHEGKVYAEAAIRSIRRLECAVAMGDSELAARHGFVLGLAWAKFCGDPEIDAGRHQQRALRIARYVKRIQTEEKADAVRAVYEREKAEIPRLTKRQFARNKAAIEGQPFGSERTIMGILSKKK